ncbi:3-(3-hydroxyphenyl)propionate hydroxylase [Streptomyces avidinii]
MTAGTTSPDVLVVGAGPVGLCTAIELVRRGVRVRIVDRRAEPRTGTRACTVWQRSLEVFDLMGLPVGEYLASGVPYTFRTHHFAGHPPHVRDAAQPGTPYPRPLLIGQQDTVAMLTRHLSALGVEVERDRTAVPVAQDADGVTVRLETADGGGELVRAGWVVGAQGPHSSVRDAMDSAWEKKHYGGTQLLQVDARWTGSLPGDPSHCHLFLTREGSLGSAPLPDGRHRFYIGVADTGRTGDPEVEEVLEAARRVTGVGDLEFHDARFNWRVRLYNAVAGSYRDGRLLLAGDSAHTLMPVTAQGMNTGIQDAFNLGWKLAAVARGEAGDTLLDSYEAERRPVALGLADRNHRTYWGGTGPVPPFDRLYEALDHMGAGHTGLPLAYPDSPLSGRPEEGAGGNAGRIAAGAAGGNVGVTAGPVAGDRVPDAVLHAPEGRLFRLIGRGSWNLLAFPADPGDAESAGLAAKEISAAARRTGVTARVVGNAFGGVVGGGTQTLADPDGALRAAFGAQRGAVFLLRPDGYVAFRGAAHHGAALDRHLETVLGRAVAAAR